MCHFCETQQRTFSIVINCSVKMWMLFHTAGVTGRHMNRQTVYNLHGCPCYADNKHSQHQQNADNKKSKTVRKFPTPEQNKRKILIAVESVKLRWWWWCDVISLDNTHFAARIRSLLRLGYALQSSTHFHTQTVLKVIILVLVLFTDAHIYTYTHNHTLVRHDTTQLSYCNSTDFHKTANRKLLIQRRDGDGRGLDYQYLVPTPCNCNQLAPTHLPSTQMNC